MSKKSNTGRTVVVPFQAADQKDEHDGKEAPSHEEIIALFSDWSADRYEKEREALSKKWGMTLRVLDRIFTASRVRWRYKQEKQRKPGSKERIVDPPSHPVPNARLFLSVSYGHAERCLLIHQGGTFYQWDGTCWPTAEDRLLRSQLYAVFEHAKYLSGWQLASFAPTAHKVADLLDATKGICHLAKDVPTPTWLADSNQPASEIVSCKNGLVHWPSRTLLSHRPSFYTHFSVPFAFDPNAPAPVRWIAFLDELWGADRQSISTLQEMFGYLVSGDTAQQKMFLLIGPKRGGKGTIARVLTRMLGRHNAAAPTLSALGMNFGLQDLIGKPVAIVSDARIGTKTDGSLIAERLLSVSGEDLLQVDRKYQEPWSGYLPTRFLILTNELPRFSDASGALASRFIVLMLHKSFYGKENPALTDQLCTELPGIFNWALDGLQRLRMRGHFVQPTSSDDAIQELEDLSSPVSAFVRDCCKLGFDKHEQVVVIYAAYRQWAERNGRPASTKQIFGRDLRAAHPEIKITRPRDGDERHREYLGIEVV